MKFTYESYKYLVELLRENNYSFGNYHDHSGKCVILRHDIDYSLFKALEMARFEKVLGVNSTYFVLLTSDFYNVFSKLNFEILMEIASCGHEIGLHFDETRYNNSSIEETKRNILTEANILSQVLKMPISSVSMHRPSKKILESNLKFDNIVNSYGQLFFSEFKYLSDSRRRWREPIEEIVKSNQYTKLHILTHAFWYEYEEKSIESTIKPFINRANIERYEIMKDNITDLESIMRKTEVLWDGCVD